MAWSYSVSRRFNRQIDGQYWAEWTASWSITEQTPTSADTVRLLVSVQTDSFVQSQDGYVWYSTDAISCGSESVTIRSRYRAGQSYSAEIEVPASWSEKNVTLRVAWSTISNVPFTPTIALPSQVSASDGVFGIAVPITITPSVSGVRHELSVSCAGRTEVLLTQTDTATSANWTTSVSVYAPLLPSSGSAQATITCETFYGGVSMGSEAVTITMRFADGAISPQCVNGWAAASVVNEGAVSGFTVWIQGKSRARVTFDATKISPQYGASVTGYAISCDGVTVTQSPFETGILPGTSAEILCTVTDSRGQSTSERLTVTLLPYASPTIANPSILRCDAQGDPDEDGQYIGVMASAAYSPLNGENSATLTAATRTSGGSWSAEAALTSGVQSVFSGFSADTSYEVRITVTDQLGLSATFSRIVPTRRWAMKFRPDGNGVAFGKAAETDSAMELGSGWRLVLRDTNGNTAYLDYARLVSLLGGQ